jgi:sugar phosphate isomerase/epimerase
MDRRKFITRTAQASAALSLLGLNLACAENKKELFFKISLAQWSLHRAIRSGEVSHLDFAEIARKFNCEGLEYVNGFFFDKAKDISFLNEMNSRAKGEGVDNVLIMIDREGSLATPNSDTRNKTIENHYKWIDAAHHLGCHAIRVNLAGGKNKREAAKAGIESLEKLSAYAKGSNINVLVENHGGFSSDGGWMQEVFSQVKSPNCGTLPDFGNFCVEKDRVNKTCIIEYDRYKGIEELLPFAKAVSAKSRNFDANGNEIETDFLKVMTMVKNIGYRGFVGIEFEGSGVSEFKGIELTRDLLIKVGNQLS